MFYCILFSNVDVDITNGGKFLKLLTLKLKTVLKTVNTIYLIRSSFLMPEVWFRICHVDITI